MIPLMKRYLELSVVIQSFIQAQITKVYREMAQPVNLYNKKIEMRKRIFEIVSKFHVIDLYVVGSSVTGLGTVTSDTDMCIVFNDYGDERVEHTDATALLEELRAILSKYGGKQFSNTSIIAAKVPLLKIQDPQTKMLIELNIGNTVGIRNTHLLKCYADLDERVPPLVIAVKNWATSNDINSAHQRSISSYSLSLMVIHYLQYSCNPPVLPCLQLSRPDMFNELADIRRISLVDKWPSWSSSNKAPVSELFVGFMTYYATKYDFKESVASVRTGKLVSKLSARAYRSPMNNEHDWQYLGVEEPFDRTNTARSVYDPIVFDKILTVFQTTYQRLAAGFDYNAVLHIKTAHPVY